MPPADDNDQPQPQSLSFHNLHELEPLAARVLPPTALSYYKGYSDDGVTARENLRCWARLRLVPRILRNVSNCDPSIEICGKRLSCPVIVAPMAMHGLADNGKNAERATVRAAGAEGAGMGVSTMANVPLDELAAITPRPPLLLFQLYVLRDRDLVESMVRRAERSGYDALVVTVDAPRLGRREGDEKNRFALPEGLELGNLRELAARKLKQAGQDEGEAVMRFEGAGGGGADPTTTTTADAPTAPVANQSGLFQLFASEVDDSLDWSFLPWLKSITSLPVWVKGLLHPADAVLAAKHGAAGVVVSNHGGRQLDASPSAADALPAIAQALGGTGCLIIADGGVRRGVDVVKALALGAHAVMVGRPMLYALAVGGEAAQRKALALLREETELALALCGLSSAEQARREGRALVLRGEYGEVPYGLADDGGL